MKRSEIIIDKLISERRYRNLCYNEEHRYNAMEIDDDFVKDLLYYKDKIIEIPSENLYLEYFPLFDNNNYKMIIGFIVDKYVHTFFVDSNDCCCTRTENINDYQKYDFELKQIIRRNKLQRVIL